MSVYKCVCVQVCLLVYVFFGAFLVFVFRVHVSVCTCEYVFAIAMLLRSHSEGPYERSAGPTDIFSEDRILFVETATVNLWRSSYDDMRNTHAHFVAHSQGPSMNCERTCNDAIAQVRVDTLS